MRSAKFLTADLVYIYRPNLHVTDRRHRYNGKSYRNIAS